MSLPQNTTPPPDPAPADPAPEAPVESASTEPTVEVAPEPAPVEDPAMAAEDATDAELRAWAKDNGIDGVPASGKLSATWRDQITAAMAAAAEPVVEEETVVDSTDESTPDSTEEETLAEEEPEVEAEEVKPTGPEWESGVYRSVFQAPNTFITSQEHTTWQ